ncbi:hypothetical protein GCK72_025644 [Caenorhabditis remanei]|uniref:Piwi domain-containing protein n=1 Tax=Caenorhabditis remanei TaxID=31234 RepID=A0A6A5G2I5_CAERE|nr:hypothetical protein GCK72_025644 [Caenorhabditis remanei]KAF1749177.1 hypothetical protein GCK72_025644 [Caenorhabditis remanei]
MPSKSNKKKAAAERSAKLAAESGNVTGQTSNNDVQAIEETTAPVTTPTVPTAQMSSLSVSSTPAKTSQVASHLPKEEKNVASYQPPAPLKPLQANQPIKIISNSYKMDVKQVKCYRYDVKISIEKEGKDPYVLSGTEGSNRQQQAELTEILSVALREEGLDKIVKVYDGATTLYSTTRFNFKQHGSMNTTVDQSKVSESLRNRHFRSQTDGKFSVSVEPNQAQPELLTSDLLNKSLVSELSSVAQMLHIALGEEAKAAGFLMTEGGSEMFDRTHVQASRGIELMDGIGAGIKVAKGDDGKGAAHVILDYKKKRFFANGPLAALPVNWRKLSDAKAYLKGLRVKNIYTNQSFIIDGLSQIPMVQIKYGKDGSILKDAKERSNLPESHFNSTWPAIQANIYNKAEKRRITYSFPIEFLVVAPNQKLTPKHGEPPKCDKPDIRFDKTKELGEKAYILKRNDTLTSFGVTIRPEPIEVEGFTVQAPKIQYKGFTTAADIFNQASWKLPNNRIAVGATFIEPATIYKILILFNSFERYDGQKIIGELKNSLAHQLGITINNIMVEDLRPLGRSVEESFINKMNALKTLPDKPIVVYLNQSSDSKMHGVLKLQERLCQVTTQHLAFDKSLKKLGFSTITNIMLKLNLKAGGLNHKVLPHPSIAHLWGDKSNTLIISYDVCFSAGKVYKKGEICEEPSCVGFAYNGTKTPDAVIGDFHYQLPRKEQVDADVLTLRAKIMLNQYASSRKKLPEHIIIMRDGVSEDQHAMVMSEEFPAILSGIKEVFVAKNQKKPRFAVIIVKKRHANRLYTKKNGVISNAPPLTAIDRKIVRRDGNELIFLSHGVIEIRGEQKGTAQPLLVNMLYNDDIFKTNDEIVQLLAAMCCAHQSSNRIISLPETIYAADEYAKRGANMFQAYKQKCLQENVPIPTVSVGENETQLNFMEITKQLCYDTSCFKAKRIA